MRSLRREGATPHARAVPAVSRDFDGLLRLAPCRSVAPCNRSWGSPRFRLVRPRSLCTALPPCSGFPLHRVAAVLQVRVLARLPRGAIPYGAFPSTPALRRVTATDTSSPLPSVRAAYPAMSPWPARLPSRVGPTSRSCSDAKSVAATECCHLVIARCSLGLRPLKASISQLAPGLDLQAGPGLWVSCTPGSRRFPTHRVTMRTAGFVPLGSFVPPKRSELAWWRFHRPRGAMKQKRSVPSSHGRVASSHQPKPVSFCFPGGSLPVTSRSRCPFASRVGRFRPLTEACGVSASRVGRFRPLTEACGVSASRWALLRSTEVDRRAARGGLPSRLPAEAGFLSSCPGWAAVEVACRSRPPFKLPGVRSLLWMTLRRELSRARTAGAIVARDDSPKRAVQGADRGCSQGSGCASGEERPLN
jgi:hypothetical protein